MAHNNLWAPWRIGYLTDLAASEQTADQAGDGCFLCQAADDQLDQAARDRQLILLTDKRGILMLNRYPYTNGHLLAAPREHVCELSDLSADQRVGLLELTDLATRLLKATMNPQGFNIGMNIGRCAGAGLPGHLHMHVVPRWHGDVNFMQTVAQIRVIPQALEASHRWLKQALNDET